jgi:hypothetical protein
MEVTSRGNVGAQCLELPHIAQAKQTAPETASCHTALGKQGSAKKKPPLSLDCFSQKIMPAHSFRTSEGQ